MYRLRLGSIRRLLPSRQRHLHLSSHLLRPRINPFFASNQLNGPDISDTPPEEPKQQVEQYIRQRSHFLDPNLHYPTVEIADKSIMDTVMEHTFEPFHTWTEISENLMASPIAGSFIEFEMELNIVFGVVISEPQSKFNEFHNKLIVLTMDNELVRVYPQDIHFTAFQVIEKDWIDSLDILPNRFDEQYPARTRLVTILHQFVECANKMREDSKETLRTAYARLGNHNFIHPTSLSTLLELSPAKKFASYFHQSAKLISMHWEMCMDPSRWIVSSCVSGARVTNLVAHRCSNELPPVSIYMTTPLETFRAVSEFVNYDSNQTGQLNDYMKNLIRNPVSFDSLSQDIIIWDGKPFHNSIRALMFAVVYPHSKITNKLLKMDVFNRKTSPSAIHEVLRNVGLFDNHENPLTDPIYSSGVVGLPQSGSLVVNSRKLLQKSNSVLASLVDTDQGKIRDHFSHLRSQRQYYQDMVAYALPDSRGNSQMAFSLEKVNERRYLINIHVPDVASQLSPSTHVFESWSKGRGALRSIQELTDGETIDMLDDATLKLLLFSNNAPTQKPQLFSVGDLPFDGENSSIPCMTLTFEYNVYDTNPLKNIGERVLVSFDKLQLGQVKLLDEETLENTLTGKLAPRFLDHFKLFGRASDMEEQAGIDQNDHFNINFVFNTLSRQFLQRNRGYAASIEPGILKKRIQKSNEYDEEDNSILTSVLVGSASGDGLKRKFFTSELEVFAGAMAAEYCQQKKVPAYYTTQSVLEGMVGQHAVDEQEDEVFISHENRFLPNFHGRSYFQTVLARDSHGYVSPAAYFIGNNYLGRKRLRTSKKAANLPLGLKNGYVDVAGATNSVEAYFNQLQILAYQHASQLKASLFREYVSNFGHLKRHGYLLHGPFGQQMLDQFTQQLEDFQLAANFIADRQRTYWTLVHVKQQHLLGKSVDYNCIITRVGTPINSHANLAWAFCEELAMEVRLYVRNGTDLHIGSRVKAENILHVDPDDSWCVFEYSEPF